MTPRFHWQINCFLTITTRNHKRVFQVTPEIKEQIQKTVEQVCQKNGAALASLEYGVWETEQNRILFPDSSMRIHLSFSEAEGPDQFYAQLRASLWELLRPYNPSIPSNPFLTGCMIEDEQHHTDASSTAYVQTQTWRNGNQEKRIAAYTARFNESRRNTRTDL